jgi:hypothetical protein
MRVGRQRCAQPRRSCAIARVGLCLRPMATVSAMHYALKGYSKGTLRGGLTDPRGRAALRPAAPLVRYHARRAVPASNGHCECYAYGFSRSHARLGVRACV